MGKKAIILGLVMVLAWGTAAAGNNVDKAFQLRVEGKVDEAVTILEAASAEDAAPADVFFEMARLKLYQLEIPACLEAAERAVGMEPDNARYHHFAGVVFAFGVIDAAHHQDEKKMKELGALALSELEAALEADPDLHEARFQLVQLLTDMAPDLGLDTAGKEDHARYLEERDPIWGAKARGQLVDKKTKRELWDNLLAERGDEARVLYEAADAFLDLQETDRAAECLDKALALDGDRYYLLLRLGMAYSMQEDWERATEIGNRFLGFDPPLPLQAWTTFYLGQIQRRQGNQEGGRALIAQAEQLDSYVWKTFSPPPEMIFEKP